MKKMTAEKIGLLHPGEMGISVGASIKRSGREVCWASEERSQKTRDRASSQDLDDVGTLQELCDICSVIFSVCPPHAAEKGAFL